MSLITDQVFYNALRQNADLMAMVGGRIENTSIPVPDDDLANQPLPYIIITYDGMQNEGFTKDDDYEGNVDKVQIGIEAAASDRETLGEIMQSVRATVKAMQAEGRPFAGCLYFGLMLTPNGPKVIEYNCRFGDPETQVVLPLLDTDLLTVMQAVAAGTLDQVEVKFKEQNACCVVLASKGYPEAYEKGFEMTLPATKADEAIYVAGAAIKDGKLVTNGGRVLGAVAIAEDLQTAITKAYDLADRIHFDNAYCRRDIGQRALAAGKEN